MLLNILLKIFQLTIILLPLTSLAQNYWSSTNLDLTKFKEAISLINKNNNYSAAVRQVQVVDDQLIKDMILWLKYRQNSGGNFEEIVSFISSHPNWPAIKLLKIRAEEQLNHNTNIWKIIDWFDKNPPISGLAIKYYALAKDFQTNQLPTVYNKRKLAQLIKEAWLKSNFTPKEEQAFRKKYSRYLNSDDDFQRANNLLWQRSITPTVNIIKRLPIDQQKLLKLRIKLIQQNITCNKAELELMKLPKDLRQDQGILYELATNYKRDQEYSKLTNILLKVNHPKTHQEQWWNLKIKQIRELITQADYFSAYKLAKTHSNIKSSDYAEGEWLAGWLAASFLNNQQAAYEHFIKLYNSVKYPISLARAAYWLAITSEKLNNQQAKSWYQIASGYSDCFYGQLALLKLKKSSIALPNRKKYNNTELVRYKQNKLIKAAYLLNKVKQFELAKYFVNQAIEESTNEAEISLIIEFVKHFHQPQQAVEISKHLAQQKKLFTIEGYPVIKINNSYLEQSLIHSIIRQESIFDQYATSSAGALGLMQIMPATAKSVAKELKIPYSAKLLTEDANYNTLLATYYLKTLIDQYQGSYILAIAAYNAGSKNVNSWIEKYGDPRNKKELGSIINWLELIPFFETRNYLQRVLQNLQVYRLLLNKKASEQLIKLDNDLQR